MGLYSKLKSEIRTFFSHSGSEDSEKTPLTGKPVRVPSKKMRSIKAWDRGSSYELLFATRSGLPIPGCPISHSAIAFRNSHDSTYSVYGRQSPFDLSKLRQDGFRWRTRVDNERKYLPRGYNFTAYPTGVFFNHEEMESILEEADRLINERQFCNMAFSNCYSFSITAMTLAIGKLLTRPIFEPDDVRQILAVMEERIKDHLSIGVANNDVVVTELEAVLELVLQKLDTTTVKTDKDKALHKQINDVLDVIHNSIVRSVSSLVR